MVSRRSGRLPDPCNPTIRGIASEERRDVLDAVIGRAPLTQEALAEYLATSGKGAFSSDSTKTIRTELLHNHLPPLKAAGLIVWDQDAATVETTDHPALDDPRFQRILDLDSDGLDAVLRGLAHEYRRIVLTVLREEREPMARTTLAREIVRRCGAITVPESTLVEEVSASLYHVHLPTLSKMDLVDYDSGTTRASYTAASALEEVLRIVYEPNQSIVDRYDGFLQELHDSYPRTGHDRNYPTGWPHFWGKFHHG